MSLVKIYGLFHADNHNIENADFMGFYNFFIFLIF